MKKENKEYFGIYINDKIPKIKDKENRYYKNIKLDFEGKAFILKDNKIDIQEELKSGKKYKKSGKHTIKFINDNQEIYYINIKITKLYLLLWLFLFAFLILFSYILFFYDNVPNSNQIIKEFVNYDVDLEGIKYVFNINYENGTFKSIELTDKVSNKNIIYPGAYGSFNIVISTEKGNKDMFYKMQVKEITNKPTNLKFKTDGKVYNSITELAENINGKINKNSKEILKIDWFWDYNTNDDITDTSDAINSENYRFLMSIIGTEGG